MGMSLMKKKILNANPNSLGQETDVKFQDRSGGSRAAREGSRKVAGRALCGQEGAEQSRV